MNSLPKVELDDDREPVEGSAISEHETQIDEALVERLIHDQFPDYAAYDIRQIHSGGTDHAMFRLGPSLVARIPLCERAGEQVLKEQEWLPILAPQLPLPIPTPVGLGTPSPRFDKHWSIYRWLEGADAFDLPVSDRQHAAEMLGDFGAALRRLDSSNGPPSARGGRLADQEADVLAAIEDLGTANVVDRSAALEAWNAIVALPQWSQTPVWTHGDLLPTNVLVRGGQVSAVIDFGCAGVGDPACDLMIAFTVLTASERSVFRDRSEVDDHTWLRGRGWAFGFGLMAYHYHQGSNEVLAAVGLHSLRESLLDFANE